MYYGAMLKKVSFHLAFLFIATVVVFHLAIRFAKRPRLRIVLLYFLFFPGEFVGCSFCFLPFGSVCVLLVMSLTGVRMIIVLVFD